MSAADGIIMPKPQVPKTLGILNIIFGVLLILFGSCIIGSQLVAPMFKSVIEKAASQQADIAKTNYEAQLKSLDEAEEAATNDEDKATFQAQRDALVASGPVAPIQPDLSSLDQFKNPTIRTATLLNMGSGIVMNIALIVVGIGLVRLREWGRSFGVILAGVQLVRLVVILVGTLVVVMPVQRAETDKLIAKLEADLKAGNAPPTAASTLQTTKVMLPLTPILTVGGWLVSSIYPILSIWLLSTAGARAACRPTTPEGLDDFPGGQ